MMRRLVAFGLSMLMLSLMVPAGSAGEVVESGYAAAAGASEETTLGPVGFVACSGEPEEQTCRDLGVDPIGGARFRAEDGSYSTVIISAQDAVFGTDVPLSGCLWHPEGDNICDDDQDRYASTQCGGVAVVGAPFAAVRATAFIFSVHVTADLHVCMASTGTAVANFF